MGSFWHRNCLDQQLADGQERNYLGSGAKNHGQTVPTMEARADPIGRWQRKPVPTSGPAQDGMNRGTAPGQAYEGPKPGLVSVDS
jgi:hypothetical protein